LENDSIRTIGTDTLVDIWIEGKIRALCVSHEAIGAFLGFDQTRDMTESDRCEFVRTHLPLIVTAARTRLAETGFDVEAVTIDVGQLPRPDGKPGDRREDDRRKGERRKMSLPRRGQPERRRNDRRQGDRRTKPAKPRTR
jgi:hypothetical protein